MALTNRQKAAELRRAVAKLEEAKAIVLAIVGAGTDAGTDTADAIDQVVTDLEADIEYFTVQ